MSHRLLTIAADLSAPPSCPTCFRDVTLFASIRGYEVVAVSDLQDMIDYYNIWFSRYGLWDYTTDLVLPSDLIGTMIDFEIAGGSDASLTVYNVAKVIALL